MGAPIGPYSEDIAALTEDDWLTDSEVALLRAVHVEEDATTLSALARVVIDFYDWRLYPGRGVCTADGLVLTERLDQAVDAMRDLGWIEVRGSSGFVHWSEFSDWSAGQGAYPNAFRIRRWTVWHYDGQ